MFLFYSCDSNLFVKSQILKLSMLAHAFNPSIGRLRHEGSFKVSLDIMVECIIS